MSLFRTYPIKPVIRSEVPNFTPKVDPNVFDFKALFYVLTHDFPFTSNHSVSSFRLNQRLLQH